ncbi:MAG: homoserine dehydrogenase [Clostridiales bacterium]
MNERLKNGANRVIKLGLLGVGTVGSGVATVLAKNSDVITARSAEIQLARIVDKDIEKATALAKNLGLNDAVISGDYHDLLNDDEIEIVVEVVGSIEMPKAFISAALAKGKSVVTANKDLMSSYGSELLQLAVENGADLFFEASVAGGIPIIQAMRESLSANHFSQIMGILNGTTNYILTAMSNKGQSFDEALSEAKALGYAEANPTSDIENYDAARKIAILASIAFNSRVKDSMVPVEGITKISSWDITYAKEFGYEIKSVGIAKFDGQEIEVRVHPAMIPVSHPLATVADSYNAVFVDADALEKAMFYGRGAGSLPTGSAIVGDIMHAARNIIYDSRSQWGCSCYKDIPVKPLAETVSKYYVRISAYDRPGVFAAITDVLGSENVSMDAVMQKRRLSADLAEIVMITHKVKHANMVKALEKIAHLECVAEVENIIRVEENDA